MPVLTIGALQPVGTTGILVDWAVFKHLGAHPTAAISAVIINEEDVEAVSASLLRRELNTFADTVKMEAVKTGLLVTRENIETVATFFEDNEHHVSHLVVDASLESNEEIMLLSSTAISLLKMRLLPLAEVVVAFPSEAERLSGQPVKTIEGMKEAAEAIKIYGPKTVMVRSDKMIDDEWVDVLYDGGEHHLIFYKEPPKVDIRRSRDVFCSSLAIFLLERGVQVKDAVRSAQSFQNSYRLAKQKV